MKRLIFIAAACFGLSGLTASYSQSPADFLAEQNLSAKEYILSQFEDHDLVIFCERDHKEFTQYELLMDVISDPRFIENVGTVFTEIGSVNFGDRINGFVHSDQPDSVSAWNVVTALFREIADVPYWHCYNYPWFLTEIQKLNQGLPESKKIALYPSRWAFSWENIRTADDYSRYDNEEAIRQDSTMAAHIIERFERIKADGGKGKALVIMNYKHAFLKQHRYPSGELAENTGNYLVRRYGDAVASVYLMGLGIPREGDYTLIQDGYWDYLFERAGKTDVGFDLAGTPFGKADFDAIPRSPVVNFTFEEMFTGLLFYKPIQEHRAITGWAGYTTEDFVPELRRRITIFAEAEEMDLSDEEIEDFVYRNNTEKEDRYSPKFREMIDRWHTKE
jgi:hypothetical protein